MFDPHSDKKREKYQTSYEKLHLKFPDCTSIIRTCAAKKRFCFPLEDKLQGRSIRRTQRHNKSIQDTLDVNIALTNSPNCADVEAWSYKHLLKSKSRKSINLSSQRHDAGKVRNVHAIKLPLCVARHRCHEGYRWCDRIDVNRRRTPPSANNV